MPHPDTRPEVRNFAAVVAVHGFVCAHACHFSTATMLSRHEHQVCLVYNCQPCDHHLSMSVYLCSYTLSVPVDYPDASLRASSFSPPYPPPPPLYSGHILKASAPAVKADPRPRKLTPAAPPPPFRPCQPLLPPGPPESNPPPHPKPTVNKVPPCGCRFPFGWLRMLPTPAE